MESSLFSFVLPIQVCDLFLNSERRRTLRAKIKPIDRAFIMVLCLIANLLTVSGAAIAPDKDLSSSINISGLLADSSINQLLTADCAGAIHLCNKDLVSVSNLPSFGSKDSELTDNISYGSKQFFETNSIWFKWKIAQEGTLSFTIIPSEETDDLDFVLFRSKNGDITCENLEQVRCMRAGPLLGETGQLLSGCTGATGLNDLANEVNQPIGCALNADNFLRSVDVKSGEVYTLLVNNFRSSNGFALGFGGSSTFESDFGNCSVYVGATDIHGTTGFTISSIRPNPATENINIDIKSDASGDVLMQIISMNGIILSTESSFLKEGLNNWPISTRTLPSGIYFIKISTPTYTGIARFLKE